MPDSQTSHDQREDQLDAIIAEYYRAEEAGQAPDQDEFIAQHPAFAKELTDFFADVLMLHRQDRSDPQDPALEPTITPNTSRQKNSPAASVVRYFGAYEILEDLGSGGMGVVYKARHLRLKKFVALKMIRAGAFASEFEVKMFEAEARAVGRLDHPGIVAVHEVGMHAGQHFYSMDYVAGGSLSKLHRDEPVPARRAAELVKQLAEALHHAHGQGIVHRDLKPANILLTTTGVPRITDFGLAKRMWIGEDSVAANTTETGQILGTPGYMSPEQAEGKRNLVGTPADIYALGAVLYALLTSRAPFVGESQAHIITQVIRNEPVSPRMLNPNVPRDLETICLKCLNKEPHARYGTAQLLADDLQRFLEGRPVLARPISRPARVWRWCRRNPWVAGLATAVVAILVIGSIVSTSLGVVAYKNYTESEKRGTALGAALADSPTLAELTTLIEAQPDSMEARLRRGKWYRQRHMWAEALADLEQALDGVAGTCYWERVDLAALHLRRGNPDAYRRICRELVAEMPATPDDVRVADLVRLVCLSPVGVDDYAPIMEINRELVIKPNNLLPQRNHTSVLCRLKLWKEAVEAAKVFLTKYHGGLGPAQPMLFEAIALQNLGEKQTRLANC